MFNSDDNNDFLDISNHSLGLFFCPNSVAIIGASETNPSVGRTVVNNLIKDGYKGKIFPVNPKRETVLGLKCYFSIKDINEKVDLAIIIVPAKSVAQIITECGQKQIKHAIIISAGFKELGPNGLELENEVLEKARHYGIRIIGPNCLGLINPHHNFNASFASTNALKGQIGFISQSGAMCTAVLDWSIKKKIGFSAFISIGSMSDVNFGDLIDYLGNDPNTSSILIYMETIGNARAFMSAAKEVALTKPIIIIKPGKTVAAALAAASHTGSLAGSDEVFDAAMHQAGVLRVDTISDLFNMALVLSWQPMPKGANLNIVTNAGGPAVLATDALISGGGNLPKLSDELLEELNSFLPPAWSHNNPIDVLGDTKPETYGKVIKLALQDPHSDAVLAILAPQDMTDPLKAAQELIEAAKGEEKPILTSWMGGKSVDPGIVALQDAKIPNFRFPDNAAQIFAKMWTHAADLKSLYETPQAILESSKASSQKAQAAKILQHVFDQKRDILTEHEAKEIIEIYGFPISKTYLAHTKDEAVLRARLLNYPVVLKLNSTSITHKTDVGGVKLNLNSEEEVRQAFDQIYNNLVKLNLSKHFDGVTIQPMIKMNGYELIIGSSIDEQFGPVILFGLGGTLVEVFKDKALALPPLNTTLAKNLIKKTKIYNALIGARGRKQVDLQALEKILVRFSELIVEQPLIKECDINPLIISDKGIVALDARIILHNNQSNTTKLALRPYPLEYVKQIKVDGANIEIRPIKPEDEPLVIKFHNALSKKTVRERFLKDITLEERIDHNRLIRICAADYDKSIAIIALHDNEIIGIARLSKIWGSKAGSFTAIIIDKMQNKGIGTKMIQSLIDISRQEGIENIFSYIEKSNYKANSLFKKFGFKLEEHSSDPNKICATYTIR
jgi:acetyltransferase